MRKKLFLVLAVVCLAAVFAGVFAGCNNGDGKGGGAAVGDKIFTENASLDDILTALENAENFTFINNVTYTSPGEDGNRYQYKYVTVQVSKTAFIEIGDGFAGEGTRQEYYSFIDGDTAYEVDRSNWIYDAELKDYIIADEMVVDEKYTYKLPAAELNEPYAAVWIDVLVDCLAEEDGKIVIDPEFAEQWSEVGMKLEGDKLTITLDFVEAEGYTHAYEYIFCAVNATTVTIPDEILALKDDIPWQDEAAFN